MNLLIIFWITESVVWSAKCCIKILRNIYHDNKLGYQIVFFNWFFYFFIIVWFFSQKSKTQTYSVHYHRNWNKEMFAWKMT